MLAAYFALALPPRAFISLVGARWCFIRIAQLKLLTSGSG